MYVCRCACATAERMEGRRQSVGSLSLLPPMYGTEDCILLIRLDQQTLPGGPSCKSYMVS